MDNNKNSVVLDVKLDVKEKKFEFLKKWTKSLVKIEAIKCFPCYIKIIFILDDNENENINNNMVLRINIPGPNVQMAKSRTKQNSYGLFWKSNRKDCCIFFALDIEEKCKEHMEWLKCSISKLELHRENILLNRRTSRYNKENDLRYSIDIFNDVDVSTECSTNIKDIKDIFEPLPKLPFNESNWSRRISGMSGIYEEISDIRNSGINRVSRASGIYEEMKPYQNVLPLSEISEPPPPLPPRTTKTNQFDCEIQRSHTNPETESFVRKKYLSVFEMFRRTKKTNPTVVKSLNIKHLRSNEKKCKNNILIDDDIENQEKYKPRFLGFDLLENKRNSFSSPDLTKFNQCTNNIKINNSTCSTESKTSSNHTSYSNTSFEFLHINENEQNPKQIQNHIYTNVEVDKLNISEQIRPSFNISSYNNNTSTINLVGSNFNDDYNCPITKSNVKKLTGDEDDNFSGYCIMNSTDKNEIKFSNKKPKIEKIVNNNKKILKEEKNLNENNLKLVTIDRCFDIKFRFDDISLTDEKINLHIYENISTTPPPSKTYKTDDDYKINDKTDIEVVNNVEEHYVNMMNLKKKQSIININETTEKEQQQLLFSQQQKDESLKLSSPKINTFDEKIPSYYPNIYTNIQKTPTSPTKLTSTINKKNIKNVNYNNSSSCIVKHENLYISTPQMKRKFFNNNNHKRKETNNKIVNTINKQNSNIYIVNNEQETINNIEVQSSSKKTVSDNNLIVISTSTIPFNNDKNTETESFINDNNIPVTQRIYQKYATLTRTPNKYIEKSTKKMDLTNIKKFTSLPRFKNIDFSPLKLKINNVLQRNNSDC